MIQLTANLWNGIIASRYHLPDLALAGKHHECVSMAVKINCNVNDSPQKTLSRICHASLQELPPLCPSPPQNHFNLPHLWLIYQCLNTPTQHFIVEACSPFNSKLSHPLSMIIWSAWTGRRSGALLSLRAKGGASKLWSSMRQSLSSTWTLAPGTWPSTTMVGRWRWYPSAPTSWVRHQEFLHDAQCNMANISLSHWPRAEIRVEMPRSCSCSSTTEDFQIKSLQMIQWYHYRQFIRFSELKHLFWCIILVKKSISLGLQRCIIY